MFALLGPNGRGKTTFLKLLLGAIKPCAGRVALNGRVAFVPQLFQVSFDYSALDMVLDGPRQEGRVVLAALARGRRSGARAVSTGSAWPISPAGHFMKCREANASS